MKKLLIATIVCVGFAAPSFAAESLSVDQMDQVTAGTFYLPPISIAKARSSAEAAGGYINYASTKTSTAALPGYASSCSSSTSATVGVLYTVN